MSVTDEFRQQMISNLEIFENQCSVNNQYMISKKIKININSIKGFGELIYINNIIKNLHTMWKT